MSTGQRRGRDLTGQRVKHLSRGVHDHDRDREGKGGGEGCSFSSFPILHSQPLHQENFPLPSSPDAGRIIGTFAEEKDRMKCTRTSSRNMKHGLPSRCPRAGVGRSWGGLGLPWWCRGARGEVKIYPTLPIALYHLCSLFLFFFTPAKEQKRGED